MFSGQKIVLFCIMAIFVVAILFRHRGRNTFRIFNVTEAFTYCRVVALSLSCCSFVVVAKVNYSHLPSSAGEGVVGWTGKGLVWWTEEGLGWWTEEGLV